MAHAQIGQLVFGNADIEEEVTEVDLFSDPTTKIKTSKRTIKIVIKVVVVV